MGKNAALEFACYCLKVTKQQVLLAIKAKKIQKVEDVICYTEAGGGCTACHPLLKRYLSKKRYLDSSDPICSAK